MSVTNTFTKDPIDRYWKRVGTSVRDPAQLSPPCEPCEAAENAHHGHCLTWLARAGVRTGRHHPITLFPKGGEFGAVFIQLGARKKLMLEHLPLQKLRNEISGHRSVEIKKQRVHTPDGSDCIGEATSAATSGLARPVHSKLVREYNSVNAASDLVRYRCRPRRRST